jgi:Zn-dependent protease with chaperone function
LTVGVARSFADPIPQPTTPDDAAKDTLQRSGQEAYKLPPDKVEKAIAISRIRDILDIVGGVWGLVVLWVVARRSARVSAWTERLSRHRWVQGVVFFAVLLVIVTLANLPIDLYGHFVSRSYGISVQGWASWTWDQAKGLGLTLAIGTPVLLLFNWIVRQWPRRYWLGAWLVMLPLMVAGTIASPFVEPLFNKYEPLAKHHAELVAELEKVAARTGTAIPPERMYLMEASTKTNGLNAYVSGLGATKRIVVWDTTAGRIPDDEVLYIFGHESGHYVLHHIVKGLAGSAVFLFFVFWACAGFAEWMVRRFGARWGIKGEAEGDPIASRAGFVVLVFAVSIALFVLEPVSNAFSRHFEHEADVYGQEAVHGIVADPQKTGVAAFNALGEAWLEDPNPSPFIEFWEYNHPSVKNRANFAAHYDPWANGGRGKFFDR